MKDDDKLVIQFDPWLLWAIIESDKDGTYQISDNESVTITPPPTEPERKVARAILKLWEMNE